MAAKKETKAVEEGLAEVQAQVDAEQEQGFTGFRVDPTPLEHYTVDGVTTGKPTPETDEQALAAAQEAARQATAELAGPSGK